ncbi:MAG: peroxiredoxin-like family protein [Bacteroidota bacterium]
METLQLQLDATTQYFLDNLPEEANATFQDVLDKAIASHISEKAPSVGQLIENFELPHSNGTTFKLSDKLKEGPIVMMFYRGSWCPYCNLMLKRYQDTLPEIKKLGANLVAISPEFPEKAQETITNEGFSFAVLTDADNQLAERLGLLFQQNQQAVDLMKNLGFDLAQYYGEGKGLVIPIPGVFVIQSDRRISYSYVNPNYRFRAEPSEVLEALR